MSDTLKKGSRRDFFMCQNMIFDQKISVYAKIAYMYLVRLTDSDQLAFPSHSTIAEKCGISKSSARRGLGELEQIGLLHKKTMFRPKINGKGGGQTSNNYTIFDTPTPCSDRTPPLFHENTPPVLTEHPPCSMRTTNTNTQIKNTQYSNTQTTSPPTPPQGGNEVVEVECDKNFSKEKGGLAEKRKSPRRQAADTTPYTEIEAAFREICPDIPNYNNIEADRALRRAVKGLYEKYGMNGLKSYFQTVAATNFNFGTGWKPNFAWLVNPANFAKVSSGKYESNGNTPDPEKIAAARELPMKKNRFNNFEGRSIDEFDNEILELHDKIKRLEETKNYNPDSFNPENQAALEKFRAELYDLEEQKISQFAKFGRNDPNGINARQGVMDGIGAYAIQLAQERQQLLAELADRGIAIAS